MTTHISTHNPVRSDVQTAEGATGAPGTTPRFSRSWALAGIGAGVTGIGAIVSSGMVNAVYDEDLSGNAPAIVDKLADQTGAMLSFHILAMVSAVLLVVFAAGLQRRLRARLSDSITSTVAFAGLIGTAVVTVIGTGLNTEFIFGLSEEGLVDPVNAVFYNHWIGTIPWCWVLAGLTGLAVFVASRASGAPVWIGRVGLVLGGLTLLIGVSPLQYMAGMTGPLLVLVTAIGFTLGDKAFRQGR